jgi:ABC-type multidrug transport system permease subunit
MTTSHTYNVYCIKTQYILPLNLVGASLFIFSCAMRCAFQALEWFLLNFRRRYTATLSVVYERICSRSKYNQSDWSTLIISTRINLVRV